MKIKRKQHQGKQEFNVEKKVKWRFIIFKLKLLVIEHDSVLDISSFEAHISLQYGHHDVHFANEETGSEK